VVAATRAADVMSEVDEGRCGYFRDRLLVWRAKTGDIAAITQVTWKALASRAPISVAALLVVLAGLGWSPMLNLLAKPTVASQLDVNRATADARASATTAAPCTGKDVVSLGLGTRSVCLEGQAGRRPVEVSVATATGRVTFHVFEKHKLVAVCGCSTQ